MFGKKNNHKPLVAKNFDAARIARKRYSLVVLNNGSRTTVAVLDRGKEG